MEGRIGPGETQVTQQTEAQAPEQVIEERRCSQDPRSGNILRSLRVWMALNPFAIIVRLAFIAIHGKMVQLLLIFIFKCIEILKNPLRDLKQSRLVSQPGDSESHEGG
ncbi:hypothetical protein Dimus_019439 [Dionaea muscipula]